MSRKRKAIEGNIRGQIENLQIGQMIRFPISRLYTVTVTASNSGMMLGRKYHTRRDRVEGYVYVWRDPLPIETKKSNENNLITHH